MNPGAITITVRPGDDPSEMHLLATLKDLMKAEFKDNRASGYGPTKYTELFVDMVKARYEKDLALLAIDDDRIREEMAARNIVVCVALVADGLGRLVGLAGIAIYRLWGRSCSRKRGNP
jgi:hypothetical protein